MLDDRICQRIRTVLCAFLAALPALACQSRRIPLYQDPMVHQKVERPPLALYQVDWWTQLVLPSSWEYLPREPAAPAADADGGRIIVLTHDKTARAVSMNDGRVQWSFTTRGPFTASALIHEAVVYVPGGDGTLYALEADSGQLLWSYDMGEPLVATPAFALGKILAPTEDDAVVAVEARTGKLAWRYRREGTPGFTVHGAASPRIDGQLAYIGFSDGALVALNVADGSVKWERALSTPGKQFLDVDTTPVLDAAGRLFAASYKDGIYAMDRTTGLVQWHTARSGVTDLLLKGRVLFAAGDGEVEALQQENGRSLWAYALRNKAAGPPVAARGFLIVPTGEALIFLDALSGKARSFWNPGKGVTASPLWNRSQLYVLSNLGFLYAMHLTGGGTAYRQ